MNSTKQSKYSKVKLNIINNDLIELQKKFAEFGELFSKYPNLDKFISNQQRKGQFDVGPIEIYTLDVINAFNMEN